MFKNFCTHVLSLSLLGSLVIGCASSGKLNSENPEEIYTEAQKLAEDGYYLDAKEHLDELRRRFPQSRYAVLGELKAADLEYDQENFTEAAIAYGTFVELYPNHAESAYAQFRKADSYFKDNPDNIARDQIPAKDAVDAANQLLRRYPGSKFTADAQKIVEQGRLRLAQKEAYVARFYTKKDKYKAAYQRWVLMLSNFKDLEKQSAPEAAKLLSEAQEQIVKLKAKLAESSGEGDS